MLLKSLFMLLLIASVAACGGGDTVQDEQGSDTASIEEMEAAKADALRKSYVELKAKREHKMPSSNIFEKGKVNPYDEALKDTAFFVFREQLLLAIAQKDAFSLLEHTEQDVQLENDVSGIPQLVETWGLGSPEGINNSEIWPLLESVLMKGGGFDSSQSHFYAPYWYYPLSTSSDKKYGVINARGVRIRQGADLSSPVVKTVSLDKVEYLGTTEQNTTIGDEAFPWIHVRTTGGNVDGYVWAKFYRDVNSAHIIFAKNKEGEWLISTIYK